MKPPSKVHQLVLPDDLEPVYTNLARISHGPGEVILDFARMLPGQLSPRVISRLIMSPLGAKLLLRVLGENLARYEAKFGEISLPGNPDLVHELFRTVQPPDSPTPSTEEGQDSE